MAAEAMWEELAGEEDVRVAWRRPSEEPEDIDMTPMIDCVFLLLIFFLVGSSPDVQTAVELPPAQYGTAADPKASVILTIADRGGPGPALVYLADGKIGSPLPDDRAARQAAIAAVVERGRIEGKTGVIIKAERSVRHADVSQAADAAAQAGGMKLFLAVFETD